MPFTIRGSRAARVVLAPAVLLAVCTGGLAAQAQPDPTRPFGTLREQAALQQAWLEKRLDTFLPGPDAKTRHRHVGRADARVQRGPGVLGRSSRPRRSPRGAAPSTCSSTRARPRRGDAACVERIALGGTSQGGVFDAGAPPRRSSARGRRPPGRALGRRAVAGCSRQVIEERKPKVIGIDVSPHVRVHRRAVARRARGHERGARPARGRRGSSDAEGLPLDLIASRLPEEEAFFQKMQALVWGMTTDDVLQRGDRSRARRAPSDLVWWWRQRVNDLGLGTWFQPRIEVQRQGATERAARRGSGHPAGRRAALRRRHHGAAPQHRHAAHGLRAARGRDRRAGRAEAGARQRATRCRTS